MPPTREQAKAAMDRIPPDLHRLLLWLLTGRHAEDTGVMR